MKVITNLNRRTFYSIVVLVICFPIICRGQMSTPEAIPINQIDATKIDQTVTVTGKIVNVIPPTSERAPYSFYINDGTETIRLVIWKDIYNQILGVSEYSVAKEIVARGTVKSYRSKLEIHLLGPKELRLKGEENQIVSEKPAEVKPKAETPAISAPSLTGVTPIGSINKDTVGAQVRVRGKVTNFRASWSERAPNIATIEDGSGITDVVYWQDVDQDIPAANKPQEGKTIEAIGYVNEYRGRLQIRITRSIDIRIVSPEKIAPVGVQLPPFHKAPLLSAIKQMPGKNALIAGKITGLEERDNWIQLSITLSPTSEQVLLTQIFSSPAIEHELGDLVLLKPKNNQIIIYIDKSAEIATPEKSK